MYMVKKQNKQKRGMITMSIKITKTIKLEDFKAWSGGADRLETIKELGILEEAQAEIEAMLEGQEDTTETTVNDLLWFEMDDFISQYEEEEGAEFSSEEFEQLIAEY